MLPKYTQSYCKIFYFGWINKFTLSTKFVQHCRALHWCRNSHVTIELSIRRSKQKAGVWTLCIFTPTLIKLRKAYSYYAQWCPKICRLTLITITTPWWRIGERTWWENIAILLVTLIVFPCIDINTIKRFDDIYWK